uniref:DM2 domain-containing protein n=1 Tax=viral metagenome TaxID=1070528 RepID=A0A6C0ES59_9ZZZZ
MAPTKAQKKVKAEKVKVEPVVDAPVVVEVTTTTSTTVPVDSNDVVPLSAESSCTDMFAHLNKSLHELSAHLATLRSEVKSLEKNVSKELRVLDKINAKKNKNKGNRAPSGFVKPTKISNELADFLGRDRGSLMARTDVTKQMTAYIRKNSLQDKDNGRIILPDPKLKKLLKLADTDALTYFNLQKYMGPHFEKSVAVPVVV